MVLAKLIIAWRDLNIPGVAPRLVDEKVLLSIGRVLLCCSEDIGVGLALGVLFALRPPLPPAIRAVMVVAAYVGATAGILWAIVNIQAFHAVRHFVSLSLLQLAGGFKLERSVYAFATPLVLIALVFGPLAAALAVAGLKRCFQRHAHLLHGRRAATALGAALIACLTVGMVVRARWFTPSTADFSHNPVVLLATSSMRWLRHVQFEGAPVIDRSDFLPQAPAALSSPQPSAGGRPNVVIVVMESVGATFLHLYGGRFPTTPTLDREAPIARVFTNAYATAPYTAGSALAIFGSEYNAPSAEATILQYPEYPVASGIDWFHSNGYGTHFFASGSWDYANLPRFLEGFDTARDGFRRWHGLSVPGEMFEGDEYTDEQAFTDALRALPDLADPFVLMIWTDDTHSPYRGRPPLALDAAAFPPAVLDARFDYRAPPEEARYPGRAADFRRYLSSIAAADQLVGDLLASLRAARRFDNTIVVVTGDHGEAFGQHGSFSHSHGLYEEDVRVPLLVLGPGVPIGTHDAVVSLVDLWPTLAKLCHLGANPMWQGRTLFDPEGGQRSRSYFSGAGAIGVRDGRFKYIWHFINDTRMLFDLASDPGETHDISSKETGVAAELSSRVLDFASFQESRTKHRLEDRAAQ